MSNLTISAPESKSIPIIEAGMYTAVCTAIIDLGEHYNQAFDNTSRKILFQWEIPDEKIEIEGEMKPRVISETYTASLAEKSNLRKALESWRGRQFTQEELECFDLENVLGAPCMLNIIHKENPNNGRTYANISTITRLPKNCPSPVPSSEKIIFSLNDADALQRLENFPEWIQKRIKESNTYKDMTFVDSFTDISAGDIPF